MNDNNKHKKIKNKLLYEDTETAKALEKIDKENRENDLKIILEKEKKLNEKRIERDMLKKIISNDRIKKNLKKINKLETENKTKKFIEEEVNTVFEIEPQIIELDGFYRYSNFNKNITHRNVKHIEENVKKQWLTTVSKFFPMEMKLHETGAKIIYLNHHHIYHWYVLPCISILYDKKTEYERIDQRNHMFTNNDNKIEDAFRN